MTSEDTHPLFLPVILLGGVLFGFGLGLSQMARPEVVLDFLQFEDFGLLFVMGGAAAVTAVVFAIGVRLHRGAPLTGRPYERREKSFDRNVLVGGTVFGVGWGLSGICPGAAYASLGVGNMPILWAIGGMFVGAYVQGYLRAALSERDPVAPTTAD
ncbi:YeeE/YedE family protein [Halogeometricum borinquense]|uniref:YeeE/YedE family protein n=1 Tax=Halogeometricum borinquense TaxID=60847 RepID=A0A6C0UFE6_9EURY|nr:DUF6691 family protein [Halogeometricum borinquense]QIB74095.1 YeeE/YedE family protein [Halogeometricum borinquense]QIQ76698.1 YeeE/YedE family protein [Halogeometricum borinquense]